jgi:hypothetical protein
MRKYLTLLLIILPTISRSQEMTYQYADSVTYGFYLKGNWDSLIVIGKEAIKNEIDFKYLRQRLGYAFYLKGDYQESINQYEKAYNFDKFDEITNLYLYYGATNIGEHSYALYHAKKLSEETRKWLDLKPLKLISFVDLEYNHKWNNQTNRSDPDYLKIGLNTRLNFSSNLYQAFSRYSQNASYADEYNEYKSRISQIEYYALLSKSIGPKFGFDIGYHFIKTNFDTQTRDIVLNEITERNDTLSYPGNLFFTKIRYKLNRFNISTSASLYSTSFNKTYQFGLNFGMGLPGKNNIYLWNSIYYLKDNYNNWLVSSHSAGLSLFKKFWMEASATFGDLTNFTEMNGMYIYNSFDPTSLKTGLSLYYYMNKHISIFTNYSIEKKQNIYLLNKYIQNSVSSGMIYKF